MLGALAALVRPGRLALAGICRVLVAVSTIAVPSLRETVKKLGRLELPEGAEEEAEEVIAAFEENVAGLEADPNASERLESVQNKKAKAFDFEACGQG